MSRNYLQLPDSERPHLRLSDELNRLREFCQGKRLTFGDLVGTMEHRSHALLVLVVALPFLLPVPLPGLSIPIGVLLVLVGIKYTLGHRPWLPNWLYRKKIPEKGFDEVLRIGAKTFRRFEKFVKPRGFLPKNPVSKVIDGTIITSCGLLLSLPLPPGTNFPPALCVILVAIGILEKDAVVSLLGYLAFIANLIFFSALFFYGAEGIQWFSKYFEFIKKI